MCFLTGRQFHLLQYCWHFLHRPVLGCHLYGCLLPGRRFRQFVEGLVRALRLCSLLYATSLRDGLLFRRLGCLLSAHCFWNWQLLMNQLIHHLCHPNALMKRLQRHGFQRFLFSYHFRHVQICFLLHCGHECHLLLLYFLWWHYWQHGTAQPGFLL